jgi:hypothetical protein
MTLDLAVLAERAAAVERHLARVAQKLPSTPAELLPNTDASDSVIPYESVDLARVHRAATPSQGPADLRAFVVAIRDRLLQG